VATVEQTAYRTFAPLRLRRLAPNLLFVSKRNARNTDMPTTAYPFVVQRANPSSEDARVLLDELSATMALYFGAFGRSCIAPCDAQSVRDSFFIARTASGEVMGCGAYRRVDSEVAELIRIYSRQPGLGVGRAVLAQLEFSASAAGDRTLIVDATLANRAAKNFFWRIGFEPSPGHAPYGFPGRQVTLEKALVRTSSIRRDDLGQHRCEEKRSMNLLLSLFGEGKDLDSLQMGARAIAVFFGSLILIRIGGRRAFGQRSPFDYVVAILLGATLSRVIVGASPAIPTVIASLVIVLIHRILGWACVRSPRLERFLVGAERQVYKDGRFDEGQLSAGLITRTDIFETVRQELHSTNLDEVQAAVLERNGQVSLIRKPKKA
jgi:ribosomal protein S18 acetylase RimI-like enzyme